MRRFSFPVHDDEPEDQPVNLTPLIDVVFVVLILFILIAPLVQFERIHLAEGKKEALSPMGSCASITINVYGDDSIQINGQRIEFSALFSELEKLKRQSPQNTTLRLFHDKKACFGTYQHVKNGAQAAGFEAMDVVLQPN